MVAAAYFIPDASSHLLPSFMLRQWSQKSRSSEDVEPLVVVPKAAAVVQVSTVESKVAFFRRRAEAAPQEASVKIEVAVSSRK